jgi:hypothetical protein
MQITKNQLRQIIKEELASVLRELDPDEMTLTTTDEKPTAAEIAKGADATLGGSKEDIDAAQAEKARIDKERAAKKTNESRRRKVRRTRRK